MIAIAIREMKKILTYLFFFVFVISNAQKEASNWYFGDNAGIKFNADGSVTSLTNGALGTDEGCASISDKDGNLLFYTDGITVWNRLHQSMPNGTGLYGDPSSTQSAIIVPKPEDANIYYIFTVDTQVGNDYINNGFNYSIVDLSLNGGLGDIVDNSKNINLLERSTEKISAVLKDCITQSIWVITLSSFSGHPNGNFNTFHAYEVSSTNFNTSSVTSTIPGLNVNPESGEVRGYLKFSPDGKKLAIANTNEYFYIFDFDPATGIVSNQTTINIDFRNVNSKPQSAYGLEFSPNSNILYVSSFYDFFLPDKQYGALLQYDLTAADIADSEVVLDDRQTYRGALQLGPNGKIYRSLCDTYDFGTPYLGVINNPNELGTAANYEHNAISLGRNARQGLPPFITSFFVEKIDIVRNEISSFYLPLCTGETYTLTASNIPGANYTWTKDDNLLSETDFDLEVNSSGNYKVFIGTNTGDCENFEGVALVEFFAPPIVNQPEDIIICDGDNDGNYNFENFSDQDTTILGIQDPNIYQLSYHLSQNDADNNINPITFPYNNEDENPQEIFVRLGLNGNNTCYDTSTSFMIYVYNTPIANNTPEFIICDEETITDPDPTNGQTIIDLHQFDIEILGTQNASEYSITYYDNVQNATNKTDPLNFNYYNQTPYKEEIYARIENNLYEGCFDISQPISLSINPKPQYTNTTLIQCDEDGINDNITLFNLLEAVEVLTNNESNREIVFYETANDILTESPIEDPVIYQNLSNPQIIFVKVIDTNTECSDIAELTLEISTNQINNYDVPAVCDELNSEDGINTFNLNDITTQIQLENNITFPIEYYESYEDALSEENRLDSPYNNTQPYTQTLYARAENGNACYGISEVQLTINKLPELEDDSTEFYCLNTYPEIITLNAGIINDSPTNYSYLWSTGETSYEIEVNQTAIYTVVVTNNINNCSKTRTITLEPSNIPQFETPPYNIKDASSNNSITVFVTGEGLYQYALYDDNSGNVYRDYQDSNLFENVYPGIYTINIIDIKNDCGSINTNVSIIGFPKYFTPNNDGVNDTWQIIGVSNMFQPNTKITIYNRFGKLIKQISPLGDGWDGLFNGERLPADDYWFSVKLQDGRIFKNHFTLKY